MKLVIHTQYRENYGSHDWDGKGECPQYWKFKGGSTYVVPNILGDSPDILNRVRPLIEYGNYGSEEYILDYEIVENNAKVCESWESVTQIFINEKTGDVVALKVIDNREDGWMRSEILEKTESWTMMPESERKDYSASYLMRDGDICDSESDLKNWFDTCGQVEVV